MAVVCWFSQAPFCQIIAQEENSVLKDTPVNQKQNELELEEVVVTAQKREEKIQEIPISMDAFSESDIEKAGIFDIKEMTFYSPNVYSKQNINQNMVIIRGISSHNVALNTPAGLFVDDISYPLTVMQNPDLINIERIEVLRGPQGTLYGKNTESGAIRVITRQPDNEFLAKVFAETGIYDIPDGSPMFYKLGLNLSGPVIEDKFYLGIAYQQKTSKGYFTNEYNDDDEAGKIDHQSGQATLRWTPSQKLDISLVMNQSKLDDGYAFIRYTDGIGKTDRYKINWDGANYWEDTNSGQALKIVYSGSSFTFTSITTHNDFETKFGNDCEFGPYAAYGDQIYLNSNTGLSQEFRLSNPDTGGSFDWIVGYYTFADENEAIAEFLGQARDTDYDNHGQAIFGQVTYSPMDTVHITAGLRYDVQESDGEQVYNLSGTFSKDIDHAEMLPKAAISVDVRQDAMVYASVSKGLLAGGYNTCFATSADNLTFEPEITWNYELGGKTAWMNRRLILNAAIYQIDITDKQVSEWLSGPSVRSITNAAKASSSGIEMDFKYLPMPAVTISGGIGISDARIKEWTSDETTGGQYDYADKKLPYAPEYTYNVSAEYKFLQDYFIKMDVIGVGDFYTDAKNEEPVDSYSLFNLNFGKSWDSLNTSFWIKNVFDEEYYTSESDYLIGTLVQDGVPRTIGVTAAYLF